MKTKTEPEPQWEVSILLNNLLPELVLIYPWVVFSVFLTAFDQCVKWRGREGGYNGNVIIYLLKKDPSRIVLATHGWFNIQKLINELSG